jgi:hypothetical protein
MPRAKKGQPQYLPTPQQIEAAKLKIQEGWTEANRKRHCVTQARPVEFQEIHALGRIDGKSYFGKDAKGVT